MLYNQRLLSLLFSAAAAVLLVTTTHAEPGDVASDEVLRAINEAKMQGANVNGGMEGLPEGFNFDGMPGGDMADSPPKGKKPEKVKREKKKKSNKKKSAKEWSKLDVNEMGEDWEDGDDEDELEHEYERIQRIAEMKKEKASKVLRSGNSKKIKKVMESGDMDSKGGMVFITLTDLQLDGVTPWDSATQDQMCGRWTALLRTASLQANVYNLEPGQVLLQVDKGWMFKDVMHFVMTQPEVVKGYKDGKDYLPSMYLDDDEL